MPGDRTGDVDARIIDAVSDGGAVSLKDLVDAVEADIGTVYASLRRLEASGRVRSTVPGRFTAVEDGGRPTDPASNQSESGDRTAATDSSTGARGPGTRPGARGTDGDSDRRP